MTLTRWHAAGWVRRWFPDVRGRDRLLTFVSGPDIPESLRSRPVEVRFGPGLHACVDLTADGSFTNYFFMQYEDPVLVPLLTECLSPGAVYYDVGANVGIYALWAAKLVGAQGKVFAFEPVPRTADWLERAVTENELSNVVIVRSAVSASEHEVRIELIERASGRSHIVDEGRPRSGGDTVTVQAITLDAFCATNPAPAFVKIDVEGHEPDVVAGMAQVLERDRPVVAFEAPDTVGVADGTASVVAAFEERGYRVWSLTTKGLAPYDAASFTHNLVALHERDHRAHRDALARTHFNRNQNT